MEYKKLDTFNNKAVSPPPNCPGQKHNAQIRFEYWMMLHVYNLCNFFYILAAKFAPEKKETDIALNNIYCWVLFPFSL